MASPYRADHIGSMLRTQEMLDARRAYDQNEISWDDLRAIADREALKAIEVQRAAGVDVFTDGEYRRSWWAGAMFDSLEGLIENPDPPEMPVALRWQGTPEGSGELAHEVLSELAGFGGSHVVGQKLTKVRSLVQQEAAFLKEHAPGPWKITFAAVSNRGSGWYKDGVTDQFYPTVESLVDELVAFLNSEIKAIIDMGVSYVQLDSLRYTQWMNERGLANMRSQGLDPDAELDQQIAWDNASIEGARGTEGVTVGHHICRGNNRSAWAGEGAYDAVAEKLFNSLNVDRFLLEYDDERSGGFEPLRFVPDDKMVVLGIVSSKLAAPETKDDLLRRIEEASKYIPVERLAISPQCGFASTMPGNLLSWDEQQRKLELVAEVAEEVWGR